MIHAHRRCSTSADSRSLSMFAVLVMGTLLWSASPGVAATHRVDSAKAAAEALAKAQPGDVVQLADGLYTDFKLAIKAAATPDRPITFKAANPGKATLTGESHLTISGKGIVVEGLVFDQAWRGGSIVAFVAAENCRLTACAFIECGNPKSTFGRSIEMTGASHHNRVDHCYMTGNLSMGMGVKIAEGDDLKNTDNTFDHNFFRDISHRSSNGQEAVQLGQGGTSDTTGLRATVEFNLFERASGDPEIISNKSAYNILRYNTFKDCPRSELVLRGGHHVRVEGNFFFRCKGGIRVHGTDHVIVNNYIEACGHGIIIPNGGPNYARVLRTTVAFNTLVDCDKIGLAIGSSRAGAMPGTPDPEAPGECTFANNLITAAKGTIIDASADKTLTWTGNIVWPKQKAQPGLKDPGITIADPALAQVDGLWRLPKSNSPALGAAKELKDLPLTDDIDGQPRKAPLDIGCDQSTDTPITRRPLEPKDVGPAWMKGDPTSIKRIDNPKPIPAPEKKKK